MKPKAKEGCVTLPSLGDWGVSKLLYSVGKGHLPPPGEYESLSFCPEKGTTGIFVLATDNGQYPRYLHYYWKYGKVFCHPGLPQDGVPISVKPNGSLMVKVNDSWYVTDSANRVNDATFLVEPRALLCFINGDITESFLKINAKKVEERLAEENVQQVKIKELEAEIVQRNEDLGNLRIAYGVQSTAHDSCCAEREKSRTQYRDLVAALNSYRSEFRESAIVRFLSKSTRKAKLDQVLKVAGLEPVHEKYPDGI